MTSRHETLIERLRNADRTAFDDIVAWYADDVIRLAVILLGDEDEARDALQETMLRLVRMVKNNQIRSGNGSIKGFLLTTARNLCLNRLKQKKRFIQTEETEWELFEPMRDHNTPGKAARESDFLTAFQEALTHLPPVQRVALAMREIEGESYQSIAQTLDMSVDSVKKQVYRGLKKLRHLLKPYAGQSL